MQCYTQSTLMMKHVWSLWKDAKNASLMYKMQCAIDSYAEKSGRMNDHINQLKMRSNASVKKSLQAMLGSQDVLRKKSVFTNWGKIIEDKKMQQQADLATQLQKCNN